MQDRFPLAWEPPVVLTVDESLWTFKGRTYMKRFMPDKPKKYGFLKYGLCIISSYFYQILVHHLPGKEKRKKWGLNSENLDRESNLQLKLQARYGEQGAIVMRLVSKLKYEGHHIIGDNTFSSVQLAADLKAGYVDPTFTIPKSDYTGTQKMQNKTDKQMHFAEYKNLPTKGWDRMKKYSHQWYSTNKISVVHFSDKKNSP